jgi:hypothetical protein
MLITQETVTAEMNYRLERAGAAALAREVRRAHRRPSRLRRWLTRPTLASPAFRHSESRVHAH